MAEEKLVGILVGRENTFPPAFIDRVNSKNAGVRAEFCLLGGTRMDEPRQYDVIVDRISHEIPYYRAYLKKAVVDGTVVINNPFWWSADDKFVECVIASKQGIAVPRTVVLPQKSYVEGVVTESLRNLKYPLDWNALAEYVGFPAFMKPFVGGGWKNVYKVHNVEELIWCFDQTGELGMILQEGIAFEKYARCICLGQSNINIIRYEPGNPFHLRYGTDDPQEFFGKELYERIYRDAVTLTSTLGYDMDTVEFAVRDNVPYAIDWLNPACDMDYYSVTPRHFEWCVENMANLVIERAMNREKYQVEYRWDKLLNAAPPPADFAVKDWTEFANEDVAGAHQEQQAKKGKGGGAKKSAKSMPVPAAGSTAGVPEDVERRGDGGPSIAQPVPHGETTP